MSNIGVACDLVIGLFIILFVLHVACFIVLVNCLSNAFVICLCVVAVLLLNVSVLIIFW